MLGYLIGWHLNAGDYRPILHIKRPICSANNHFAFVAGDVQRIHVAQVVPRLLVQDNLSVEFDPSALRPCIAIKIHAAGPIERDEPGCRMQCHGRVMSNARKVRVYVFTNRRTELHRLVE